MKNSSDQIFKLAPFVQDMSLFHSDWPSAEGEEYPASLTWRRIEECLPEDVSGWSSLEIGAHDGLYSLLLARRGVKPTAVTSDQERVERLNEIARLAQVDLQIHCRPNLYLEKQHGKFDLVLSVNAFQAEVFPLSWLSFLAENTKRALILEFPLTWMRDPRAVVRQRIEESVRWLPGFVAVEQMLRRLGFEEVVRLPYSANDFADDGQKKTIPDRVFLVARHPRQYGIRAKVINDLTATVDRSIKLKGFSLRSTNQAFVNEVKCGDPLSVELELEGLKRGCPLFVSLMCFQKGDCHVCAAGSIQPGEDETRITFYFDSFLLVPGDYDIVVKVFTSEPEIDSEPIAVFHGTPLTVAAGDKQAQGVSRLICTWMAQGGLKFQQLEKKEQDNFFIQPIRLFAPAGNEVEQINSGDGLIVEIPTDRKTNFADWIWEVVWRLQDGFFVYGMTSQAARLTPLDSEKLRVIFPRIDLGAGRYFLSVRIVSRTQTDSPPLVEYPDKYIEILSGKETSSGIVQQDQKMIGPDVLDTPLGKSYNDEKLNFNKLELLGSNRQGLACLETEKPFSIRLTFTVNQPLDDPVIRFQIFDVVDGVLLWGVNNHRAGKSLAGLEPGRYQITVEAPECRLLGGRRLLKVSAWSHDTIETNRSTCYDAISRPISVISKENAGFGAAALSSTWSFAETEMNQPEQSPSPTRDKPGIVLCLMDAEGSPASRIKKNGQARFAISLNNLAENQSCELAVTIESDKGRRLYNIRNSQDGLYISDCLDSAEVELKIADLPLLAGSYRAKAFLLNHSRSPFMDPARIFAISDTILFEVDGDLITIPERPLFDLPYQVSIESNSGLDK